MNTATLPATLESAHQLIEQLQWRVAQLEKELFGPSAERQKDERLSKEQILMSLFPPPAQPAATQQVLVRLNEKAAEPRVRRQPAAKVLETVTERIEPAENEVSSILQTWARSGRKESEDLCHEHTSPMTPPFANRRWNWPRPAGNPIATLLVIWVSVSTPCVPGGTSKHPGRIPGQLPPLVSPANWNVKTSACGGNWPTPNGSVKS